MRPIKINVTKEHIRNGVRGSSCDCPIALAIKETLITANVCVDLQEILVNHVKYDTEKRDRNFIDAFDEGKPVRPYSFELGR